jgi:general secretion pathway protein N
MTWLPHSRRSALAVTPHWHVGVWAWVGAVTGALLALLWCAPAVWLASAVAQASGQQVQLRQAQGSIWQGSAQLVLAGGPDARDARALPGQLHWQLRPIWLGLELAITADCCTATEPLRLSWLPRWSGHSVQVLSRQTVWPAALLAGLGTPWNTLQPQGRLVLNSDNLVLHWTQGKLNASGQGSLQALDMSSPISTLRPMGSYELTLSSTDITRLQLRTLSGDLHLAGEGLWTGAKLRFQGTASASAGKQDALNGLLNLIGRRQGAQSIISLG